MRQNFTNISGEDCTFRVKFNFSNSTPIKLKMNKVSSVLDSKNNLNEDSVFNIKFNSSNSAPIQVKTNESSSTIDVKGDFASAPSEDVYYDEIIYYDGGGVDGYGD